MQVRVKMNKNVMAMLTKATSTALTQTAEAIKTDVISKNIMPFDDGTMQNESVFIDDSKANTGIVLLSVDTPYARRLYFHPEYNFSTEENPNAQGLWFEPWISGEHKNLAMKAFRENYKRLTGV
ncbi:MAG: hypothetical protein CVU95_00930 [Firmicutes bacterium HGW-Firmicutes-2]|nr:MAG: hypothetical protein CVU95_00930 [Firmicutes bacterium HGW-Firmicutes-2]